MSDSASCQSPFAENMNATLLRQLSRTCRSAPTPAHIVFSQTRTFRQDENFTFDWKKVPASLEKEREKFDEYSELVGDARFSQPEENSSRQVEYVATRDPAEWRFVQRLVDAAKPRIVPGEVQNFIANIPCVRVRVRVRVRACVCAYIMKNIFCKLKIKSLCPLNFKCPIYRISVSPSLLHLALVFPKYIHLNKCCV